MPLYDGTGPTGAGPMTGRKRGLTTLGQIEEQRIPTLPELMRDVGPALRTMGKQYQRAAPLMDWFIDNYHFAIFGLGCLVFGAAALGAWYGSKEKKQL